MAMQHPQGAGEPPYGVPAPPTMAAFSLPPVTTPAPASSDVLLSTQPQVAGPEEFPAAVGSGSAATAVNSNDDDMMMVDDVVAGGVGGSGSSGNRWPREETLALIRIRSEMDAAFRNATLKAPVWEELSRRLAELGYQRSGKKCKEKFENVDKYYKRTKEGRTGRQDGKSYRFFSQLEALHAAAPPPQRQGGMPVEDPQPLAMARMMLPAAADLGFLSMSSSESESDDESDDDEEAAPDGGREGLGDDGDDDGERSSSSSSRKLMAMFEGMMRQVTEKQDAMQRVFLETLEKWEAERTEREEAWRRKEVARINREREQLSKERAAAASRDAALIAFLQRVGGAGEPVKLSPHHDAAAAGLQLVPVAAPRAKAEDVWGTAGGDFSGTTAPSRWPKEEVQALIDLRMEKEEKYNDMGPKGPLWEEIAAGMQRIGYRRSAKRCKEKWENINKYFKKVKESNKRRPEDSKTCPYFHQLDAIYRKKHFAGRASGVTIAASHSSLAIVTVSEQENPSQRELEGKSSNDVGNVQLAVPLLVHNAPDKKVEGSEGEPNITAAAEETDSDEMGGNYTDDCDDDDKMQYKIEFQKPTAGGGGGGGDDAPAPATTAAATSSAPASNTSFLAVQ